MIITVVLWAGGWGVETADLDSCPMNTVLLQDAPLPLFDQVSAEDVVPGITQLITDLNKEVDELEKNVEPTWSGLVEPLEQLTDRLSRAWSTVSHLKVLPLRTASPGGMLLLCFW